MTGEILINSSDKLFKTDSNLVMIQPLQSGAAAMSDKISEVQHNMAADLIAIRGSVVIAPSILEMIRQILEMIRQLQYSPRVVQSGIAAPSPAHSLARMKCF